MKFSEEKLESVKAHPLFHRFSQKQQDFCLAFLETRNPRKAAYHAYRCPDDKSADYQARKLLKRWEVRKLLTDIGGLKFQGYPLTSDEAIYLVSERVRDESIEPRLFVDLIRILAAAQNWRAAVRQPPKPPEPEQEESVLDAVHKLEIAEFRKKLKEHYGEEKQS